MEKLFNENFSLILRKETDSNELTNRAFPTVRRLLKMKVDPDSTNEDGLTALHQVSTEGPELVSLQ